MSQVSSLRSQKLSKNLKTFKKSENFQKIKKFPKIWKLFRNLKINNCHQQLSSTIVINNCHQCLKGHRSLGSLFNVKKQKWLSESLSQWVTRPHQKHRKNCECCHHHSLFKGHNVNVNIVVLNCQKCNQCLKCQVLGHKSLGLLFEDHTS